MLAIEAGQVWKGPGNRTITINDFSENGRRVFFQQDDEPKRTRRCTAVTLSRFLADKHWVLADKEND